jgi:hypothetical protein
MEPSHHTAETLNYTTVKTPKTPTMKVKCLTENIFRHLYKDKFIYILEEVTVSIFQAKYKTIHSHSG